MELKFVAPNIEKTFGHLYFGSLKREQSEGDRDNRKVVARTYELFSDLQKDDNIEITIPAKKGEKGESIEVDAPVTIISPRIATVGYRIGDQAFVRYICNADDIVPVK
ncbi:YdcP family protein [Lacticaseibacillus paracasei]|uniref:YdcP family protein n=1 Tax=Lacticaseibacillus paracasei TaxID=1597 RepID=UPI002232AC5E|nr:YdcP family protein [Lacticaseibacillus paracasei]UZD25764.1 YdcP family protein [Lacticaseibacillus paracasei]